jgi:hypothetical protein
MTPPRPTYGTVDGEKRRTLHRFSTIAGRSCCGKSIVPLPGREKTGLVVCQRCTVLDAARRAGMPDWF